MAMKFILSALAAITLATTPAAAGEGRDHALSQSVQYVGNINITVTRIESNDETLTIYFDVLNEGDAQAEIALAGSGYGRNGTYVMAGGRKIVARRIGIAGFYGAAYLKTDYAPHIPKSGLLLFEGWDGELGELSYLEVFVRRRGYHRIPLTYDLRP